MQTLSDVLLDCRFFSLELMNLCPIGINWNHQAVEVSLLALEVGLKSRRMRRADYHCTISNVDLMLLMGVPSHTTDA